MTGRAARDRRPRRRRARRCARSGKAARCTYLGLMVAGFPNMFVITGPGSPSVKTQMIARDRAAHRLDRRLPGSTIAAGTASTRIEPTPRRETRLGAACQPGRRQHALSAGQLLVRRRQHSRQAARLHALCRWPPRLYPQMQRGCPKGLRGIRTVTKLTRRTALALAPAIISFRAEAAEFTYKYGNQVQANHPVTMAMQKAADRIKTELGGRLEIAMFPNSQLGGDTDMLSQIRTGALEFFTCSPLILSTLVPCGLDQRHRLRLQGFRPSPGRRWTAISAPSCVRPSPSPASWRWRRSGTTAIARSPAAPSRSSRQPISGLQDPRAGEPALDLDVQGLRRLADQHQFQRGLFGAADQDRRWPGEPSGLDQTRPSSTRCRNTAR